MQLNLFIKKGALYLTALLIMTTPTYGQSDPLPVLTLEQATQKAISMDINISHYNQQIEVTKAKKEDIANLASLQYQTYATQINQSLAAKDYRKDVVAKNVMTTYQNIILLQENINILKKSITLQERLLKAYTIQLDYKMCDQLTYDKQAQRLTDLKMQLEKTQYSLNQLKTEFSRLTYLDIDRYTLTPDYTYEPLVMEDSITTYASRMATELTRYQKQLAELSNTYFWDTYATAGIGGTAPTYATYFEGKVNVAQGLDNVETLYKNYKGAIESQYFTTSSQFNDLKIKETAYNTAKKDLKPLEIKYELGYVSELTYLQQLANIDAANIDYLTAVSNYRLAVFQLENPWTLPCFNF